MDDTMKLLQSVEALLEHVKLVEEDTIELSRKSLLNLSNFLEAQGIEIDDSVAEALQYQDIIAQQLTATIEAIESVQKSILQFSHAFREDEKIAVSSMEILQSRLGSALERAKEKRQAFSGNVNHENDDDAVEFF